MPGATTLILTVNPDAGRSSATTFRPDALYEFVVASNGGTREDIAFRVTFAEPDGTGNQQMRVLRADGDTARHGTEGTPLGEGCTGEVFSLGADGLAWAGLAADPFTADGVALATFLQGLAAEQYDPDVFTASPVNIFAGRDVTAIALQVPDADLGGTQIAVWARITLFGHAPQLQVSRIGQAMLRPLFFSPRTRNRDPERRGAEHRQGRPRQADYAGSPAPPPASPGCPILTPKPSRQAAFLPTWSPTSPASPPPSNPAAATGAHSTTTPSTSPWLSWPDRNSETLRPAPRHPGVPLPVSTPALPSCHRRPLSASATPLEGA